MYKRQVVVVEDLISTGGSSLKAVEAIRRDGCEVIGMVAAYTYGFPVAEKAFKDAKVPLVTLTNYEAVKMCIRDRVDGVAHDVYFHRFEAVEQITVVVVKVTDGIVIGHCTLFKMCIRDSFRLAYRHGIRHVGLRGFETRHE